MDAGKLRSRVVLEARAAADDGAGNKEGGFVEQFRRSAMITPLRGGEEVMAQRLQGIQPAVIRLRFDSQTVLIAPGWRVNHLDRATVYAVRSVSDPDGRRQYIDIIGESGRAV